MNLKELSQQDASLVQAGLKALGFYHGTTRGFPGSKTTAAYNRYLKKRDANGSFAKQLAATARGEVGNREIGKNGGAAVRKYQRATWLATGEWPWCAAFVCWCVREALEKHPLAIQRPRTAGAWDFERWARKEGAELIKPATSKVREGDILVYTFSHIGIAVGDEQSNGEFNTVEGNTNAAGSREGDGVYMKIRRKDQIRSIIRL